MFQRLALQERVLELFPGLEQLSYVREVLFGEAVIIVIQDMLKLNEDEVCVARSSFFRCLSQHHTGAGHGAGVLCVCAGGREGHPQGH